MGWSTINNLVWWNHGENGGKSQKTARVVLYTLMNKILGTKEIPTIWEDAMTNAMTQWLNNYGPITLSNMVQATSKNQINKSKSLTHA